MALVELLDEVTDQQSFFLFVEALIGDFEERSERWENPTMNRFLEAGLAWAKDSRLNAAPSWKAFAEFLYAGTLYE